MLSFRSWHAKLCNLLTEDVAARERDRAVEMNGEVISQSSSLLAESQSSRVSVNSVPSLSSGYTASELESLDGQLSLHQEYAVPSTSRSPSSPRSPPSPAVGPMSDVEPRGPLSSLNMDSASRDDALDGSPEYEVKLPDATDVLAEIGSQFISFALDPMAPLAVAS